MSQLTVAKKDELATVRNALEKMKPQLQAALPKHLTPERLCRVAMTAIQNTPKLLDCDRMSLYSAVTKAAQLGLEPDGILGQAYLIPYGKEVQFIPGYKGLIDLARRSGEVSNIIAKEVYENDEFSVDWSQDIPFVHKPCLKGERGEIIIFWALAKFKDGGFHWDYMTVEEVMGVRDASQGYKAAVSWSKSPKNYKTKGKVLSPWEDHFVEMGKKTVIRRIAKFLPMSVQRAAAFDVMQEAGKKVDIDDYGDITIDGTAEETADREGGESAKLDGFAGTTINHEPVDGESPVDESQSTPLFDIAAHDLDTQQGAKEASIALVAYLREYDEEERQDLFIDAEGEAVVAALSKQGLGMEKKHYEALGITL